MRVVVLADTHLRDRHPASGTPNDRLITERLPAELVRDLHRADLILHAGDLVGAELLTELKTYAPVLAVLGNNDVELVDRLPATIETDVDGVPIAMIHDSGARDGRELRMQQRFPTARLVVFGHSHLPEDNRGAGGQRLFNPGSPTQRRRAPEPTYGLVHLTRGRITGHRIVPIASDHDRTIR